MTVPGDNPISKPEDDALGRTRPARALAEQVLALDWSAGLVVGVLGPWGSGKTSFVNLARTYLEDASVTVLDFNPWMFGGAEQLVESFFVELAAQLRVQPDLSEIGKDLEEYGETFSGLAWLPLVGPWVERGRSASKLMAKILQRRKEGVGGRRKKLEDALSALDKPIVVVLDDIDRLTTSEIRDIFKLIRLTANFPNVIYVVAFDRKRVEDAVAEQRIPGRDYLEKIIQVAVDLPAVPPDVVNRQVFAAIDEAIDGIDITFSEEAWPDAYMEIIRPLINNMRDVRRYAAAVHGSVKDLGDQIELVDVLSLEAIRVFLPDVFSELASSVDALTTTSDIGGRAEPPHLKTQINRLVEAASPQSEVVIAAITRLFPAAQRHVGGSNYLRDSKALWLRERRVAHEDLLRLYLERSVGEGLQAFVDAEHAWNRMNDRGTLDGFLRSLDRDRLQDVIGSLEAYEDEFQAEHAVPGTIVLLNLLPDLPERQRGMFDLGPRPVVRRVIYRLLRCLPEEAAIEAAIRQVLPELQTLSAKLDLIDVARYGEGAGHQLVSDEVAAELERNWRDEVRNGSVGDLIAEPELLQCLYITFKQSESDEASLIIEDNLRLTAAILASAKSERRTQPIGSRAVRRSPRLDWETLVQLYRDEDTLRQRIEELRSSDVEGPDGIIELAEKYLEGWRPDTFHS